VQDFSKVQIKNHVLHVQIMQINVYQELLQLYVKKDFTY